MVTLRNEAKNREEFGDGYASHQNLIEFPPVGHRPRESHDVNDTFDASVKPLDVIAVSAKLRQPGEAPSLVVAFGHLLQLFDALLEGFHVNRRGIRSLRLVDHLHRDQVAMSAQLLQLLSVATGAIHDFLGLQQGYTERSHDRRGRTNFQSSVSNAINHGRNHDPRPLGSVISCGHC